jgi:hypothetical protein
MKTGREIQKAVLKNSKFRNYKGKYKITKKIQDSQLEKEYKIPKNTQIDN